MTKLAEIRLADYLPPRHLVGRVELDVDLHAERTIVRSRLQIAPNPEREAGPLVLDGEELELRAIAIDGKPLGKDAYTIGTKSLTVHAPPRAPFELSAEVAIVPRKNTMLLGLYEAGGLLCTQCEAEGFRRITYFPDRPDVMSEYRVRMSADKADYPVLLANGNEIERGDLGGGRHFAVWHDPFAKPAYLFAMVAGRLGLIEDTYTTSRGRTVALRIYCDPGKEDRCHYAMDALKRSMRWDEEVFGLEYDLDIFMIVAVSAFNFGAMENKGLNIFNDKYILASPETATDIDYENIESVVAHEYFHNYTGNRVTCRDWFQLCLKEGLTVLRDQLFSEDMRAATVERIDQVETLRLRQFAEDRGPLAHPVRPSHYVKIDNFYTATVYEKGAELCRMLMTMLGRGTFIAGVRRYLADNDGRAATVEDFVGAMARVSGRNLDQFFTWYTQAGTPELSVAMTPGPTPGEIGLILRQRTAPTPGEPMKRPVPIPVRIAFIGENGEAAPVTIDGAESAEPVLVLDAPERTVAITGVPHGARASVLRGFSAPVTLAFDQTTDDLLFLLARDTDHFNRWEAGQRLMGGMIARAAEGRPESGDEALTGRIAQALGDNLHSLADDPATLARILAVPSEQEVARQISVLDPEAIFHSRQTVGLRLSEALADRLAAVYDNLTEPDRFEPTAGAAGRRALRKSLLRLLAFDPRPAETRRAKDLFDAATNMTDRMTALGVLTDRDGPERQVALDAFFERYKNDPLVTDKWLTLNAVSRRADTLARVAGLTRHPAFRLDNPSRVHSLITAFLVQNPRFHDPSGAGYDFVLGIVREIDRLNPGVAARILASGRDWHRLEPRRRARLGEALNHLSLADNLSANLSEVLSRTLAAF